MPRDLQFHGFERPFYVGPAAKGPDKALTAALSRHHPALRRRLRQFAVVAKPCADLLTSFPAAAVAIATMERGPEATGRAVARVKGGAPLASVGEALGLPFWMRKLPPETFGVAPIGPVETSAEFARQIGNALPKRPEEAAMWLRWLMEALRLGEEAFALWIARQRVYAGPALPVEAMEPAAAFVFACRAPGAQRDPLLVKRWHPRQSFDQVAFTAARWLERVINQRCAVEEPDGGWDEPTRMAGFRFEPLTQPQQLVDEGIAMSNCLETYVGAVQRGDCRIFAVRRGKKSVADLEIRPKARAGEFYLAQLEGPGNTAPQTRVRKAVERWMATLGPCPLNKTGLLRRGRFDAARWRAEWAGFVVAHPAASAIWREAGPEAALAGLAERLRWMGEAARRHVDAVRAG